MFWSVVAFSPVLYYVMVKTRFAPSPTGPLHIGGVRTALYNYLHAKKNGGTFLLRIEDTDQKRFVAGTESYVLESLKWLGISADEGFGVSKNSEEYKQSNRKGIYKPFVDQLIESGNAYYAFDTTEELDEMRERLKKSGVQSPQYNHLTRENMKNSLSLSKSEVEERMQSGEKYVVRIKVPRNQEIKIFDTIRKWVVVNSSHLDDKVLFKSDGIPTYHMANVVDDHLMNITDVIRGEEWLPSLPIHFLLYKYFGWEDSIPNFSHLPLLLRPDGNGKLSKRDGDRFGFPVFPLDWKSPETGAVYYGFKEAGFSPEAVINFLVLLGWNPGTNEEFFALKDLEKSFTPEKIGKSGSKFDYQKAQWFNQHYLREQKNVQISKQLIPLLKEKGYSFSETKILKIVELLKERSFFIKDMAEESYFFKDIEMYDPTLTEKHKINQKRELIQEFLDEIKNIEEFNASNIQNSFNTLIEKKEIKIGYLLPVLRLGITGKSSGPSLFEIMEILEKECVIRRLNYFLKNYDSEKE